MSSEEEKIRLEHEAAKLFMHRYEKQFGVPMRHIWHNEPRKPDVSCYLNGERLDLEIAHLYGSTEEAKQLLGRDLSPQTQKELDHLRKTAPAHRMLEALSRVLQNKSQKCYESQKVWLVIRNLNPHWHTSEFANHLHLIQRPQQHPFQQMWLLSQDDWASLESLTSKALDVATILAESKECSLLRLD